MFPMYPKIHDSSLLVLFQLLILCLHHGSTCKKIELVLTHFCCALVKSNLGLDIDQKKEKKVLCPNPSKLLLTRAQTLVNKRIKML